MSESNLDFWQQSGLSKAALDLNRQGKRAPGQTTPIAPLVAGLSCVALSVAEFALGIWLGPTESARGMGGSVLLLLSLSVILALIGLWLSWAYVALVRSQRVEWVDGKLTKKWIAHTRWYVRLLRRHGTTGRGWIAAAGRLFMVSRRTYLAAPEGSVYRIYHVRGLVVNLEALDADEASKVNEE